MYICVLMVVGRHMVIARQKSTWRHHALSVYVCCVCGIAASHKRNCTYYAMALVILGSSNMDESNENANC